MQVDVELHTEDPHAGTRQLCTRGRFSMIALDANGRPAPVAPLDDGAAAADA